MNLLKALLAAAAAGAIVLAFRDLDRGEWLRPALPGGGPELDGHEPVLGFDGMDQEPLLAWLTDADLDRATLLRMRRYEEANRARETVLAAIDDLL